MPIHRTQQPGDVGVMPPRAAAVPQSGMTLSDLTNKQLIALCELRGLTQVSHYQAKAYYVRRLVGMNNQAAVQKSAPVRAADVLAAAPTDDELTAIGLTFETD